MLPPEGNQRRQEETADLETFLSSEEGKELLAILSERQMWILIANEEENGMTCVTFLDGEGLATKVSNTPLSALPGKEAPQATTQRVDAFQAVNNYYDQIPHIICIAEYMRERLRLLRIGLCDDYIRNF